MPQQAEIAPSSHDICAELRLLRAEIGALRAPPAAVFDTAPGQEGAHAEAIGVAIRIVRETGAVLAKQAKNHPGLAVVASFVVGVTAGRLSAKSGP